MNQTRREHLVSLVALPLAAALPSVAASVPVPVSGTEAPILNAARAVLGTAPAKALDHFAFVPPTPRLFLDAVDARILQSLGCSPEFIAWCRQHVFARED